MRGAVFLFFFFSRTLGQQADIGCTASEWSDTTTNLALYTTCTDVDSTEIAEIADLFSGSSTALADCAEDDGDAIDPNCLAEVMEQIGGNDAFANPTEGAENFCSCSRQYAEYIKPACLDMMGVSESVGVYLAMGTAFCTLHDTTCKTLGLFDEDCINGVSKNKMKKKLCDPFEAAVADPDDVDDAGLMQCATESTLVRSSSDSLLELCKDTIGEDSFSHLSDFRDECGIIEGGGGPGQKDGQGPPGEGQGPPDGAGGGPLVAFFVLLTCCCGVGGVAAYRNKNQIWALLRDTAMPDIRNAAFEPVPQDAGGCEMQDAKRPALSPMHSGV